MPRGVRQPEDDEIHYGAIIGAVELVDMVERSRSKWFMGPVGWVVTNPYPLKHPIPCKGGLGLWNVPTPAARKVRDHLPERLRTAID
jgi:hypothetical protein